DFTNAGANPCFIPGAPGFHPWLNLSVFYGYKFSPSDYASTGLPSRQTFSRQGAVIVRNDWRIELPAFVSPPTRSRQCHTRRECHTIRHAQEIRYHAGHKSNSAFIRAISE